MRVRLLFDGVDVTRFIERRMTPVVTAETHDDSGNQTMGEVSATLSNLDGRFSQYVSAVDPVPVELYIEGHQVMKGSTTEETITSDRDQDAVTFSALPIEHEYIESMKARKCEEFVHMALGRWKTLPIITPGSIEPSSNPPYAEGRWFLSMADIYVLLNVSEIPVLSALDGVDPNHYLVGGTIFHNQPALPDMSWWELYRALADLWNAIIYMEGGVLKVRQKESMIQPADAPLVLPYLRDTFRETNRRVGYDRVSVAFKNANTDSVWSGAKVGSAESDRTGAAIISRVAERTIPLLVAQDATRRFFGYTTAAIPRAVNDTGYIVYNPTGGTDPFLIDDVSEESVLRHHECDLTGETEWEAEYSLMGRADAVPELTKPLRAIAHPMGATGRHLIRSVAIDPFNEVATVRAMRYP